MAVLREVPTCLAVTYVYICKDCRMFHWSCCDLLILIAIVLALPLLAPRHHLPLLLALRSACWRFRRPALAAHRQ